MGIKASARNVMRLCNEQPAAQNPRWEIKIARYFGYSETTLALLKAPNGLHYMVRSSAFPYGRPSGGIEEYYNISRGRHVTERVFHWNDLLDELAGDHDNPISMNSPTTLTVLISRKAINSLVRHMACDSSVSICILCITI